MAHEPSSGCRHLDRLRQMAREERAAVAAGDIGELCRIAALLPRVMERLWNDDVRCTPSVSAAVDEVLDAHRAAEAFLAAQLSEVASRLRQCAGGRKAAGAYGHRRHATVAWLDQAS